MLYSYLLTRSEFQLQQAPDGRSRDNKYAYVTYLNILLLIMELSGYRTDNSRRRNPLESLGDSNMLSGNKLASALAANIDIRDVIAKGDTGIEVFDDTLLRIYSLIQKSAVYADYRKKKRHDLEEDVQFWTVVINTIIATNPLVTEAARTQSSFTLAGFQKGVEMVVRTINEYQDSQTSLVKAKKSLDESLEKAYELYHALLLLPVFITDMESERIESAKAKYCPTDHELNPNMRFVENAYVEAIRNNPDMEE